MTFEIEKAVYWYTKGAEGGDGVAKGNLGMHLIEGRSARRLALHHYQEASDFGSAEAREALRRLSAAAK